MLMLLAMIASAWWLRRRILSCAQSQKMPEITLATSAVAAIFPDSLNLRQDPYGKNL